MADELLDIVNDSDEVTGQAMRSVVHQQGLWHRGVHVFLFNEQGEMLIQKRSADRANSPSLWDCSVSEHVKAGESYLEAAMRGLKEEMGVEGIEISRRGKIQMESVSYTHLIRVVCIFENTSQGVKYVLFHLTEPIMKYLLSIDQGTTQTTAVIVNELGEMLEKNSAQLPARFPQAGWVEQEPEDILRTVKEACAPLLSKYEISAVGFDNQGETFVVWDAETGEAVTPAIVWQDTRGQAVCDALASNVDLAWLRQTTGLLLDSYFSAPKLKWVFENNPELRAKAHAGKLKFGTTETWVIWKLSGGKLHVTDPSTCLLYTSRVSSKYCMVVR